MVAKVLATSGLKGIILMEQSYMNNLVKLSERSQKYVIASKVSRLLTPLEVEQDQVWEVYSYLI
jgi:hypothetical protein